MSSVHVDTDAYRRYMDDLEKKQFPFAFAKTLTQSAKAGQEISRKITREVFHLHGDFIPSRIRIEPAKKADVASNKAFASVYTDDKIKFMTPHETGEDKTPQKGRSIAIPQPDLLSLPGSKSARGAIAKRFKPRTLIREHRKINRIGAFIAKGLVLVRTTKNRYPLRVLYGFEGKAKIKPEWHFVKSIQALMPIVFPKFFKNNMRLAVRDAKP